MHDIVTLVTLVMIARLSPATEHLSLATRAAHRPSDGYGRTTNGRVTGTGSPSTVRPVVSAKSQRVRTGTGTAVVRGTVADGRPPVPHSAMNVGGKGRAGVARRRER